MAKRDSDEYYPFTPRHPEFGCGTDCLYHPWYDLSKPFENVPGGPVKCGTMPFDVGNKIWLCDICAARHEFKW